MNKSNEPQALLEILRTEKASSISGGIYHEIQIELTYNSNHNVFKIILCRLSLMIDSKCSIIEDFPNGIMKKVI